jgi:hypothetical protein
MKRRQKRVKFEVLTAVNMGYGAKQSGIEAQYCSFRGNLKEESEFSIF